MPRVSVIIPTYNCARLLGNCLDSVLKQTYSDFEIIVVDDGSIDGTQEVVANYGKMIRYLYQSNQGVAAARNFGLSVATGEFIAYLDADDMWYPFKLEKQIVILESDKRVGLIHSDIDVINENGQVIHRGFNRKTGRKVPQGYCLSQLFQECHIQTLTVLIRREYVSRVGNFDERLNGTEDYLQWVLVAMEGACLGYVDEPLAMYRWTDGSISSVSGWMCEDLMRMLKILLTEKCLEQRCGFDAVAMIRQRIRALSHELAYLDRKEGHLPRARKRLFELISETPAELKLYLDLVKACIPLRLMAQLRTLKATFFGAV